MYLFGIFALALCAWGFYRRIRVYRLGLPLDRFDRPSLRITLMLKNMLTQCKVLREPGPGTLHALFFWGFGLLFIGTLLIMAQADLSDPLFHLRFLTGGLYKLFSLLLDIAGGVAIVMLGGLLVRRLCIKPTGLQTVRDDYLIHTLLFTILITGFLLEGMRMASTEIGVVSRNPRNFRQPTRPSIFGRTRGRTNVLPAALWVKAFRVQSNQLC
jgi:hypothetical protein